MTKCSRCGIAQTRVLVSMSREAYFWDILSLQDALSMTLLSNPPPPIWELLLEKKAASLGNESDRTELNYN